MSQVNHPSPAPASSEASHTCRAPAPAATSARAAPPVQARQQFDAALERAQDFDDEPPGAEIRQPAQGSTAARRPHGTDNDADPEQRDAFGLPGPIHPLGLPAGPLPAGAVAVADALPGAAPMQVPVSPSPAGLGAQSQPGQTIGGARQYSLSLPGEPNAAALSLSLSLTQASPTHWPLPLPPAAPPRQQLAPHVERLRDRLRQGRHSADFELEDDAGA